MFPYMVSARNVECYFLFQRLYNKVAKTLMAFEYLWYDAWCNSIEAAKAGLQATLIIRNPNESAGDAGKLFVNFDQELFQLMREARCLAKLDISIPESAKIVLLQVGKQAVEIISSCNTI